MFAQFQPGAETVFEDFVDAGRHMGALLLRRIGGEAPENLHYLAKPKFDWAS
jgi:LacI family transcriptional regulator